MFFLKSMASSSTSLATIETGRFLATATFFKAVCSSLVKLRPTTLLRLFSAYFGAPFICFVSVVLLFGVVECLLKGFCHLMATASALKKEIKAHANVEHNN